MSPTEHYRAAEEALQRAERAVALGDPHEGLAIAAIAAGHARLASIGAPA